MIFEKHAGYKLPTFTGAFCISNARQGNKKPGTVDCDVLICYYILFLEIIFLSNECNISTYQIKSSIAFKNHS